MEKSAVDVSAATDDGARYAERANKSERWTWYVLHSGTGYEIRTQCSRTLARADIPCATRSGKHSSRTTHLNLLVERIRDTRIPGVVQGCDSSFVRFVRGYGDGERGVHYLANHAPHSLGHKLIDTFLARERVKHGRQLRAALQEVGPRQYNCERRDILPPHKAPVRRERPGSHNSGCIRGTGRAGRSTPVDTALQCSDYVEANSQNLKLAAPIVVLEVGVRHPYELLELGCVLFHGRVAAFALGIFILKEVAIILIIRHIFALLLHLLRVVSRLLLLVRPQALFNALRGTVTPDTGTAGSSDVVPLNKLTRSIPRKEKVRNAVLVVESAPPLLPQLRQGRK
ncbi:hypothetical protein I4F81_001647 [Pyropia yezoensis]|uniref:Uncharacterized protein n=1 Tax=Pyropia yezoensis TaxID=2788 RepID=A0ACC3BM72_PYRYE|nr:hypothetical protein I4F81_001647 [Neopyropia yezoensis]